MLGAAAAAVAASQYPYGRGTGGCPLFPANNPWRENVSKLPVSPLSSAYIAAIGAQLFAAEGAKLRRGGVQAAGPQEGKPQVVTGARERGIDPEGGRVLAARLVSHAHCVQGVPQVGVCLRRVGPDPDGLPELLGRLDEPPLLEEHPAQVVAGEPRFRVALDRAGPKRLFIREDGRIGMGLERHGADDRDGADGKGQPGADTPPAPLPPRLQGGPVTRGGQAHEAHQGHIGEMIRPRRYP